MAEAKAETDTIKVFKNGKVWVRRGIVTATVDPRRRGIERWLVEVKADKHGQGYRVYYGPFKEHNSANNDAITVEDAVALQGNLTTKDKLAMARKMLDWHFKEGRERGKAA